MADLESLKKKRTALKANMTKCSNYVKNFNVECDIGPLMIRKQKLLEILQDFHKIQNEIEELEEVENDEIERFEAQYFAATREIESILKQAQDFRNRESPAANVGNFSPVNTNESVATMANVKLPALTLPTFSGSYTEWPAFFNNFKSLVHDNLSLDKTQKMQYLKSCLQGAASKTVEALIISEANYDVAFNILLNRYENKRLSVQEHVLSILNLPELGKASGSTLRQLTDTLNSNVASLKVLDIPVNSWDAILCAIISSKLDFVTRRDWEASLTKEIPKYSDLITFLENKCRVFESMTITNKPDGQVKSSNHLPRTNPKQRLSHAVLDKPPNCPKCNKPHSIYQCWQFQKMDVAERKVFIEKLKLCINCLKSHGKAECRSSLCRICKKSHNTLLHSGDNSESPADISKVVSTSASVHHSHMNEGNSNSTVLSTAVILVEDAHGRNHEARCLLDPGSEVNLITESFCKKLNIPIKNHSLSISGINQTSTEVSSSAKVKIMSRITDFSYHINCAVLKKVTQLIPSNPFDISELDLPTDISLADSRPGESRNIDILLGVEVFWSILKNRRFKLKDHNLYLSDTHLGWILGGCLNKKYNKRQAFAHHAAIINNEENLDKLIERFWDLETIKQEDDNLHPRKSVCEQHFRETVARDPVDGRFIVHLPIKNGTMNLGDSYSLALRRFQNLEKRLDSQPVLKEQYRDILKEYIELDYMEPVPEDEINALNVCYLPHREVIKENSETSRVRIVYDGSMPTTNGLSLNDNLLAGPIIQPDLFSILLKFRTFEYGLSADLSRMYLQVKLHKPHTDLQRILWRDDKHQPINIFRLKRVSFGLTSSSFLAIRCLHQLADEIHSSQPEVAQALKEGFFVDDFVFGCSGLQQAKLLQSDLTNVLKSAGFELRKWASNNKELLPSHNSRPQSALIAIDEQGCANTLGLLWDCENDQFKYKVRTISMHGDITKRKILSAISRIFDPLGLLTPFLILAKIIMQKLWVSKVDWDATVPEDIKEAWLRFCNNLEHLSDFSIPRFVLQSQFSQVEIHVFSDASMAAYGAVIYIRTINADGKIRVSLLTSKSRIAPVKTMTIPRLELSGAVLGVKLFKSVENALKIKITKRYFWTDSTIVLCWLSEPSNTWKTFVSNRVGYIQRESEVSEWRHITSELNPADPITRGLDRTNSKGCDIWFKGPEFLDHTEEQWPVPLFNSSTEAPEKRQIASSCAVISQELPCFTKFSDFCKLIRVVSYCLRFINNTRTKDARTTGPLSQAEIEDAHNVVVRALQSVHFRSELALLKANKAIDKSSRISSLSPFIDPHTKILRVAGRLTNSELSYEVKYPILLPAGHQFTKSIIEAEHKKNLHVGADATLSLVRQKYWPISGRSLARKIVRSCLRCYRCKPVPYKHKMGNLPADRLEPIKPFTNLTLDFGGPVLVRSSALRSKTQVKAYIALFICEVTKACHIELVGNLTAESFLNALKRLISRRGAIKLIRSDNATNFQGAKNELNRLFHQEFHPKLAEDLSIRHIVWKFTPPRSPHFNGLVERLMRSVKTHLNKVIGNALLTYEEMYTFLTLIESVINSRPLSPLSSDPNDLSPLTPGHFLIGEPLRNLAEPELTVIPENRLSRWQRVLQLRQHFWKRFYKEVFVQYQVRTKWRQQTDKGALIGDLVLLMEDNVPPLSWQLGRIVKTYPGADNIVRVVDVRTSRGTYRRAIAKICPLPQDNSLD